LVAEKADSAVPPLYSAAADFAAADMAAAPLPLPHSPPHAIPCQSLPALCEIRSCFAPGSAPIPEAFWHRTRPTLLPELVPILTVPSLKHIEQHPGSPPTVKQHMAAIRMLFSWLTEKGSLAMNPAREVKTQKFSHSEGKTPGRDCEARPTPGCSESKL